MSKPSSQKLSQFKNTQIKKTVFIKYCFYSIQTSSLCSYGFDRELIPVLGRNLSREDIFLSS